MKRALRAVGCTSLVMLRCCLVEPLYATLVPLFGSLSLSLSLCLCLSAWHALAATRRPVFLANALEMSHGVPGPIAVSQPHCTRGRGICTHFLHRSFIEGLGTPPPIFHSKEGWVLVPVGRRARLTVTKLSGFFGSKSATRPYEDTMGTTT